MTGFSAKADPARSVSRSGNDLESRFAETKNVAFMNILRRERDVRNIQARPGSKLRIMAEDQLVCSIHAYRHIPILQDTSHAKYMVEMPMRQPHCLDGNIHRGNIFL